MVEGVAEGVSAASPVEEVRVEAREPERPSAALVAASGGAQSSSSFPSFPDLRAWAAGRGKAPMTPTDDTRSGDRTTSSDIWVLKGASALANHNLARRLCQAILLPANREPLKTRSVIEMLSSFYPTMIEVSSALSSFFIVVLIILSF